MSELYKLAASKGNKKNENILGKQIGLGLIGATKNLLGYENVHHGTDTAHKVDSIKSKGLKKSFSGTGTSSVDVNLGRANMNEVKGKVYTSTSHDYAKHYTDPLGIRKDSSKVVKMKVPYRDKSRLARDIVVERLAKEQGVNNFAATHHLRIYKHSIPTRFIEGSKDYKGVKQFASSGNMRRYLSTTSGKLRMAKGIAQLAGSAALIAQVKKMQDRKGGK